MLVVLQLHISHFTSADVTTMKLSPFFLKEKSIMTLI